MSETYIDYIKISRHFKSMANISILNMSYFSAPGMQQIQCSIYAFDNDNWNEGRDKADHMTGTLHRQRRHEFSHLISPAICINWMSEVFTIQNSVRSMDTLRTKTTPSILRCYRYDAPTLGIREIQIIKHSITT